jgi:hypothetical protein
MPKQAELLSLRKTRPLLVKQAEASFNLRWKVEQADAVAVMEGAEQNRRLPNTMHAE